MNMEKSSYDRILSAGNAASYIFMITMNALANALPINGMTTGQLSDRYPNLFVPAGFTFSIWGLIYLLLGVFVTGQAIRSFGKTGRPSFHGATGFFFILSSLANGCWILAWHYELVALSLLIMLIIFGSLIAIYLRLGIGSSPVAGSDRFLFFLPFSVYLGWISIATIANLTAVLVRYGWNVVAPGDAPWACIGIAAGVTIAIMAMERKGDVFWALTVAWALFGILAKRLAAGEPSVSVTACAGAGIVVLCAGIVVRIARKQIYGSGHGIT
jgi:hypothetical protein